MFTINQNYKNLNESYLFSEINRRIAQFKEQNPGADIIRMGIGDVTLPLCAAVIEAMQKAVYDMGTSEGFHGYGPEQGYAFLHNAIQDYYQKRSVSLDTDEIFVSDGAKSDLGNILDILGKDNSVLIPDPVYPVYVDTNIMDGRKIKYANANEKNGFLPLPNTNMCADIIYLCSPNNPTGAAYNKEELRMWVDFALEYGSLILFDAAYEAFIEDPDLPHSIYEIEGANRCAIEFCSLSKTAGFTGTRCGYTIVPKALSSSDSSVNKLWLRRQTTKFNGVSYIIQRGAEAVFSEIGQSQIKENISIYKKNAHVIASTFDRLKIPYTGGKNSPYIWMKCPDGKKSWEYFDYLLSNAGVVGTPGAGFGTNGEGFFRLTAFSTYEKTVEAMCRIEKLK